jgi:hypothetical protein
MIQGRINNWSLAFYQFQNKSLGLVEYAIFIVIIIIVFYYSLIY